MDRLARIEAQAARAARAALDPLALPDLLWSIRGTIGGVMATMERFDKRTGTVEMLTTDRPDVLAEGREAYEGRYYKVNRRNDLALALPPGTILCDDLLGDDKALSRDEFYIDFLAKSGLRYFIGAVLVDDADQLIWTSVQRGPDQPRVNDAEKRVYRRAIPHLGNALALYSRMRKLPPAMALADIIDRLGDPIAILDTGNRVHFANRSMRAVLEQGPVRLLDEGRLCAEDEPMARAMNRLVAAVRRGNRSVREIVARSLGLEPLTLRGVVLAPDDAREFGPGGETLLCLMIDDPERPWSAGMERVARAFGLTPRKALIGSYLVAGRTAGEIALRLDITHNTVRSHVARLREKVGERSALGVAARLRAESTMLG